MYHNRREEQFIIDYDQLDARRIQIGLPPLNVAESLDSLKLEHQYPKAP